MEYKNPFGTSCALTLLSKHVCKYCIKHRTFQDMGILMYGVHESFWYLLCANPFIKTCMQILYITLNFLRMGILMYGVHEYKSYHLFMTTADNIRSV